MMNKVSSPEQLGGPEVPTLHDAVKKLFHIEELTPMNEAPVLELMECPETPDLGEG